MTLRRAFALTAAISLATMLASSANAATKTKRTKHYAPIAGAAPSCRGSTLFHCGPIYNSTDYLGNDPDPFIRAMIQRDLGAKYGGEN
jgi:hypothetical protein